MPYITPTLIMYSSCGQPSTKPTYGIPNRSTVNRHLDRQSPARTEPQSFWSNHLISLELVLMLAAWIQKISRSRRKTSHPLWRLNSLAPILGDPCLHTHTHTHEQDFILLQPVGVTIFFNYVIHHSSRRRVYGLPCPGGFNSGYWKKYYRTCTGNKRVCSTEKDFRGKYELSSGCVASRAWKSEGYHGSYLAVNLEPFQYLMIVCK